MRSCARRPSAGTAANLVLGKHSGRHAFANRLRQMGYELSREELDKAFERFKLLCDKKESGKRC
jgi:2-isopropylmalate synthase